MELHLPYQFDGMHAVAVLLKKGWKPIYHQLSGECVSTVFTIFITASSYLYFSHAPFRPDSQNDDSMVGLENRISEGHTNCRDRHSIRKWDSSIAKRSISLFRFPHWKEKSDQPHTLRAPFAAAKFFFVQIFFSLWLSPIKNPLFFWFVRVITKSWDTTLNPASLSSLYLLCWILPLYWKFGVFSILS